MRIPIRVQLSCLVLVTSLIALAVISISTWIINHRFVVDISNSRLSLTASLKAAGLASNLELMETLVHSLSTRIIIQASVQRYNQGNNTSQNWAGAQNDLLTSLASGTQSLLTLQAALLPKNNTGLAGDGVLVNITSPAAVGIQLPDTLDGKPVFLGDPGLGYPPNLYPNFTFTTDAENNTVTSIDNDVLYRNSSFMLGPWQINETFAILSITLPVINNTDSTDQLGWITVVLSANPIYQVLTAPEGLDNSGIILLVGPSTTYNKFPGNLFYDTFPIPDAAAAIEKTPVHFILAPNGSNFQSRHPTRAFGAPLTTFNITSYPAVLDCLTFDNDDRNNAGSMLSSNNEDGASVAVGFAIPQTSLATWTLIVEQSHDEIWGPIDHLRNVLFGCIFGTIGGLMLIAFPIAHFSSRPIRRLREATKNTIAPPEYSSSEKLSEAVSSPVPPLGAEPKEGGGIMAGMRGRRKNQSRDKEKRMQAFRIPARVKDRHHIVHDELTDLTQTFNEMSDELRLQYARLEERVQQRTAELVVSKRAAEAANESKTLFIANISHELKTPLNGILGMCAVCMQEDDPVRIKRSLGTIYKSGDLLHNLLTDLLTFSKNQAGQQLVLDQKEFRVRDVTSQILAIFETQARESSVELSIEFEGCCDELGSMEPGVEKKFGPSGTGRVKDMCLWGDYQRILQVAINLISNSLKFTPAGGQVHLKIRCLGDDQDGLLSRRDSRGSNSIRGGSRISRQSKQPRTPSEQGSARSRNNSDRMFDSIKSFNPLDRRKKALQAATLERSPSPPADTRTLAFEFEVKDTGPGIPEHLQQQIFEPFVQGDLRLTKKFGGTGLGLSICSQLAGLMRGFVDLQSEVGVGSTFTLHIPLRHVRNRADSSASSFGGGPSQRTSVYDDATAAPHREDDRIQPSSAKSATFEPGDAKPRLLGLSQPFFATSNPPLSSPDEKAAVDRRVRVLVADDNKINQEVVLRMLRLEDIFDVHLAKDGQEALDKVKESMASGVSYDLIFMDVQMPNLDGRESTRMIRQLGETAPIVALTAFADEINQKECMDSGMDFFLAKPIRRPALKHVLKTYCTPILEGDEGEGSSPVAEKRPNLTSVVLANGARNMIAGEQKGEEKRAEYSAASSRP